MLLDILWYVPVVVIDSTFKPQVGRVNFVYHLANSRLLNKTKRLCFNGLTLFDMKKWCGREVVMCHYDAPLTLIGKRYGQFTRW